MTPVPIRFTKNLSNLTTRLLYVETAPRHISLLFTDALHPRDGILKSVVEAPVTRPEFTSIALSQCKIVTAVGGGLFEVMSEGHCPDGKAGFLSNFNREPKDDLESGQSSGQIHVPPNDPPIKGIGHFGHQQRWCQKASSCLSPARGQRESFFAVRFGHGPHGSEAGIDDYGLSH